MKWLLTWALGASLVACSSVKKYEPPLELVLQHLNTLTVLLEQADTNQDGKLNWYEATGVLTIWFTHILSEDRGV